jgi:hypothetical protein
VTLPRHPVTLFALVALVGLGAAACGGSGYGADTGPGDCFRSGTAAAFGWGTRVSCGEPHSVEVFAVRDVSAELGRYRRAALEQPGSPARLAYLALVRGFCEPAWSGYTGFAAYAASVAPNVRPGAVLPALYGDMALEAAPADDWDEGTHTVVCYQVFGHPEAQGAQAITVDRAVLGTMRAAPASVPAQVRDCALSPVADEAERRVACTEPHDREYLGHLDVAAFVGLVPGLDQRFLHRFDSVTAPARDWAVLDALCGRLFGRVAGAGGPGVTLLAQVYSRDRSWGWADDGYYHADCFARSDRQLTHSVVGTA